MTSSQSEKIIDLSKYTTFTKSASTGGRFLIDDTLDTTTPASIQTGPEIERMVTSVLELMQIRMQERISDFNKLNSELLLSSLIDKHASQQNSEKIMRVLYSISDANIQNRMGVNFGNKAKQILLRAASIIFSRKLNPVIDIFLSEDGKVTMSASLLNKFVTLVISTDNIILGFTKRKVFWSAGKSFTEEFRNDDVSIQDLLVRLNKII